MMHKFAHTKYIVNSSEELKWAYTFPEFSKAQGSVIPFTSIHQVKDLFQC